MHYFIKVAMFTLQNDVTTTSVQISMKWAKHFGVAQLLLTCMNASEC